MKNILMLAALVFSTVRAGHSQNIVGDWQGTLKAGMAELRLVLHIASDQDGNLKATMDSVDQGANGIPVTSISLKESKLSLAVDSVHGTYEGKVNSDVTAIAGTWTQGQPLPLDFKRQTTPLKTQHKPAKPSDIDGAWAGTLDAGASKLRVVFHITNTEDGLTATMDSPDQNANGLPVTAVSRSGLSLTMELKQIPGSGRFAGKINKELTEIEGTWTQGGATLPLLLKRVKGAA